jgi:hemerythrin-like metal-binding protein
MALEAPFVQIEWAQQMATGVVQVDVQHRYLVDTLREANAKLLGDHDAERLAEVAKGLLNYAIMHFGTEEELMQQYGYAAAHADVARVHLAQHREFSRQVVAVCDRLRVKRHVSNVDVLKYLNEWLRNHVLGIDQLLGAFVREAQAKEAAERVA